MHASTPDSRNFTIKFLIIIETGQIITGQNNLVFLQ